MKVIEPLFLNELYEKFEQFDDKPKKLQQLLQRLGSIKIFDPACGSGNFLIIAYKELRNLEMEILKQLQEIEYKKSGQISQAFSEIKLSQFYGIELDDFAHEVTTLSLWLAEHQMNVDFKVEFGDSAPSLPLKASGNITCGNANEIDWLKLCPFVDSEVFILGNPPYLGFRNWDSKQKDEMAKVFKDLGNVKRLDYIGCWFKNATDYISVSNGSFSFVSTNSICQGEQVSLIWPYILSKELEILFAYKPFDWSNNAKGKAGVTCIIVGVGHKTPSPKYLFAETRILEVKEIGPYLIPNSSVIMEQRTTPISRLPVMTLGSSGIDGGFLMLSPKERETFVG